MVSYYEEWNMYMLNKILLFLAAVLLLCGCRATTTPRSYFLKLPEPKEEPVTEPEPILPKIGMSRPDIPSFSWREPKNPSNPFILMQRTDWQDYLNAVAQLMEYIQHLESKLQKPEKGDKLIKPSATFPLPKKLSKPM